MDAFDRSKEQAMYKRILVPFDDSFREAPVSVLVVPFARPSPA
jgi:hypothetical protein